MNEKDSVLLEERIKRSSKNRPLIKKPSPPEEKKVVAGRGRTPLRGTATVTETNGIDPDSDDASSERERGRRNRPQSEGMFKLDYEEIGMESDEGVECKMPTLIDHSEVNAILNKPVVMPQIRLVFRHLFVPLRGRSGLHDIVCSGPEVYLRLSDDLQ